MDGFFKHVFEAFELTLEEWVREENLVLCDHVLDIFESNTRKMRLVGSEGFVSSSLPAQQIAVITCGGVTLEDTVIDTARDTVPLNGTYSYLAIGENYFLVSTKEAPWAYALYTRK